MYIIVDSPDISLEELKTDGNSFCICLSESLNTLKQDVEEAFCDEFNLNNITIFKVKECFPVKLEVEFKEVLVETNPKKRGIK